MDIPIWATHHIEMEVTGLYYNKDRYCWYSLRNGEIKTGTWGFNFTIDGYLEQVKHIIKRHYELDITLENE